MSKRTKKKRARHRRIKALIAAFLCLFLIVVYLERVVHPIIISVSKSSVGAQAEEQINLAALEALASVHSDIVIISRDKDENITLVAADAIQVSILQRSLVENARRRLNALVNQGARIPLGNLSGITTFSGMGADVVIGLNLINILTGNVQSEFSSAGINQTRYRLFITVQAQIAIVLAAKNVTFDTSTQVLVYESIIVGKIPTVVING